MKFTTYGAARILGVTPQTIRDLAGEQLLRVWDRTDSGMFLFTEPDLIKLAERRAAAQARRRHDLLRQIPIRMARKLLQAGQQRLPFREEKAQTRVCDRKPNGAKTLRFSRRVA